MWTKSRTSCRFEDDSSSREAVRPPTSHSPNRTPRDSGAPRPSEAAVQPCSTTRADSQLIVWVQRRRGLRLTRVRGDDGITRRNLLPVLFVPMTGEAERR